ncbi:MAG: class I SAM-dependent methyltransferase [Thermoplasmatota archaeon]
MADRPAEPAQDQHRVWETIAESFDATRQRPWSVVTEFLADLPPGQRLLDLMAGNGRHAALAKEAGHDAWWCDWSRPAARLAAGHLVGPVVVGDATALPFAGASFDACIYIAGLHGIPAPEGRVASLAELRRVLSPGGRALVTVWAREAPRFAEEGPPGEPFDLVVPWRRDGHEEQRTYHLYTEAALRADLEAAGLLVERLWLAALGGKAGDNWCAIAVAPPSTPLA